MVNLGVVGHPSDWLIASEVDYKKAKKLFDINLIDIDIDELILLSNVISTPCDPSIFEDRFDEEELNKAYHIYLALKEIIKKYNLKGLTIRCFDLLGTLKSTSCLAFALLNKEGYIATCEGDIPSMISMHLLRELLNKEAFQANPSKINIEDNSIILAHCTLPLSMCTSYKFDTHYESGLGVGIKGELELGDIFIFRLNNTLDKFVLLKGKIIENLNLKNLCRTQINVALEDNVDYFLKRPLGNHHLIVYAGGEDILRKYLLDKNLKEIK